MGGMSANRRVLSNLICKGITCLVHILTGLYLSWSKVEMVDLADVVVWVSVAILFLLFCFQRFGTDKVGYTFAPCICVWFTCIALIGVYNIAKWDPTVFKAFNPYYIYLFFKNNKMNGWISLGGIVLAITGTSSFWPPIGDWEPETLPVSQTDDSTECK